MRARIVQPRVNHPLPPSIAANDEHLLPDIGMNERGASAYRFFWLKPAALAPLRAACVDPGWTIPLSVNNRRNWKSPSPCAHPGRPRPRRRRNRGFEPLSRSGGGAGRAGRGDRTCQGAAVSPQGSRLARRCRFRMEEGVVGSATLPADLRSPPGRSFQTAEPVFIKNFDEQKIHPFGPVAAAPYRFAGQRPGADRGSGLGRAGDRQHEPRDFSQDTIEFLDRRRRAHRAFVQRHSAEPGEAARVAAAAMEAQTRDVLLVKCSIASRTAFSSSSLRSPFEATASHRGCLARVGSRCQPHQRNICGSRSARAARGGADRQAPRLSSCRCLSIKQQAEGIDIDVQADELELSIDRAVPLGLILNEAATNSLKHAFGPDAGGRISVKLVAGWATERVV